MDGGAHTEFIEGDVEVRGGFGSGVIYSTGALRLGVGVHFRGLIVAEGRVVIEEGATVVGQVLAGVGDAFTAESGPAAIVAGGATLLSSPCLALGEVAARLPARPVRGRSWSELH
jgi:hypothetical protein